MKPKNDPKQSQYTKAHKSKYTPVGQPRGKSVGGSLKVYPIKKGK